MEALQHLVHDDPEALVERRFAGDPQYARELVAQRAAQVALDVGGRQHEPVAAARQERRESRLLARGRRACARPRLAGAAQQQLIERRALEDLALKRRQGGAEPRVDVLERVRHRLVVAPLQQRRQLDELREAHDAVGDVEVGVEAQLAQAGAEPGDAREQLVAALAKDRVKRLGGPEQLLVARLPLAADRQARLLHGGRGHPLGAARGAGREGEHEAVARARHRRVEEPARALGHAQLRQLRVHQLGGDRLAAGGARHHAAAARGMQAEHEDMVERQAQPPTR